MPSDATSSMRSSVGLVERVALRRPLHLDEVPGAGHDDVHVDVARGVLRVVEVET